MSCPGEQRSLWNTKMPNFTEGITNLEMDEYVRWLCDEVDADISMEYMEDGRRTIDTDEALIAIMKYLKEHA